MANLLVLSALSQKRFLGYLEGKVSGAEVIDFLWGADAHELLKPREQNDGRTHSNYFFQTFAESAFILVRYDDPLTKDNQDGIKLSASLIEFRKDRPGVHSLFNSHGKQQRENDLESKRDVINLLYATGSFRPNRDISS